MRVAPLILLSAALVLNVGPAKAQGQPDWEALETLREAEDLEGALALLQSWSESSLTGADRLRFLSQRQRLLHGLHHYPEAQQAGRPWIELAGEMGDSVELARAHHGVGLSFGAQHNNSEASAHFQAALEAVRGTPEAQLQLSILLPLLPRHHVHGRVPEGCQASGDG